VYRTRTTTARAARASALLSLAALAAGGMTALSATTASAAPCWTLPQPPPSCQEPGEPGEPDLPPPPPAAPTGVTAPSVLQTWVTVRWNDASSDEQGFRIQRQNRANGTVTTFTVGAGVTTYDDSSAAPSTPYRYSVSSYNANGQSGPVSVDVTTRPQPADVIGSATGSRIKGSSGGYSWDYLYLRGWALDFDRAGVIDVRIVHDGETISTMAAGATWSGLGTTYPGYGDNHGFEVSYIAPRTTKGTHTLCAVGVSVGGGADQQLGCVTYTQPGPPSAATALSATAREHTVDVAFTDAANDETGWYLQRSLDGGSSWAAVSSGGVVPGTGTRTTAVDYSTFAPGSGVCYRILMVNGYGQTPSAKVCL
jgi:titin